MDHLFEALFNPKTKKLRGVYAPKVSGQAQSDETVVLMNPDAMEINRLSSDDPFDAVWDDADFEDQPLDDDSDNFNRC